MTNTEIKEVIKSAGGSVRYGWSGWLDGVKGLRHSQVKALAESGELISSKEVIVRRTSRSKALPTLVITYRLV